MQCTQPSFVVVFLNGTGNELLKRKEHVYFCPLFYSSLRVSGRGIWSADVLFFFFFA